MERGEGKGCLSLALLIKVVEKVTFLHIRTSPK